MVPLPARYHEPTNPGAVQPCRYFLDPRRETGKCFLTPEERNHDDMTPLAMAAYFEHEVHPRIDARQWQKSISRFYGGIPRFYRGISKVASQFHNFTGEFQKSVRTAAHVVNGSNCRTQLLVEESGVGSPSPKSQPPRNPRPGTRHPRPETLNQKPEALGPTP